MFDDPYVDNNGGMSTHDSIAHDENHEIRMLAYTDEMVLCSGVGGDGEWCRAVLVSGGGTIWPVLHIGSLGLTRTNKDEMVLGSGVEGDGEWCRAVLVSGGGGGSRKMGCQFRQEKEE
nr:hypothetical protein [Tanacetum cinerariifolium]